MTYCATRFICDSRFSGLAYISGEYVDGREHKDTMSTLWRNGDFDTRW